MTWSLERWAWMSPVPSPGQQDTVNVGAGKVKLHFYHQVPLSKALSPKLLTQRGGGKVEWGFMNTNWCKLTNDVSQAVQKQNKSNPCTNQWEVKTSGGNKGSNPETQDTWQRVKNRQPLKHTVGVETTVDRWNTLGKAQQLTQKHKDSK